MVKRISLFWLFVAAVALLGTTTSYAQSLLTRHVHRAIRDNGAKTLGQLPHDQIMQLHVVLPLRNPVGLESFLSELYDPSSPNYRQYLTPAQFTTMFGPSQEDYDTVVAWAKASGFTIVGGSLDGMDLQIKGSVATIEKAFHVTMRPTSIPPRIAYSTRLTRSPPPACPSLCGTSPDWMITPSPSPAW